ncbi:MAG TPA: carbon storage regulator [Planctomycetaceae bacterium]|nr:carbon storage regulator [Planctomycetaceae bacterium]
MLVLTRKRNEVIRIGDDVVVTVLRTGHGSVQLGIEAPSDVNIVRGELLSFGEPSSMVSCSR